MLWKAALCKGKKVWAHVDETDALVVENGLVGIRYSTQEGATVYRASIRNVKLEGDFSTPLAKGEKASEVDENSKVRKKFGSSHTRTAEQKKAAQADTKDFLAGLSAETVCCFTDGSCVGNPGPSGTGVFIQLGEESIKHFRFLGEGTNNKAELSAVLDALTILEERQVASDRPIVICTDSKYVEGILTKGWKAKANKELIGDLRSLYQKWTRIRVRWVAGHADIPGNDEADRLANLAIEEGKS